MTAVTVMVAAAFLCAGFILKYRLHKTVAPRQVLSRSIRQRPIPDNGMPDNTIIMRLT